MFEDEDVILPDDFGQETDLPESDGVLDETPVETELDTIPTDETEEIDGQEPVQAEQNPFLKVKYNKEDMELDEATARELAQKGLNYDKVQERLNAFENDPRLSFIQELAEQHGMSSEEYIEAVRQEREQQAINELMQNNIPEEYAREMLESRKFRQQLEAERQTKAQEEKQNAEFNDFFQYFKDVNGKDFVPNKDVIPDAVWEANKNGTPLKFAYMEHQNQVFKTQLQQLKQNQSNTKKAVVGGITQHGSNPTEAEDDFLSGFNSI